MKRKGLLVYLGSLMLVVACTTKTAKQGINLEPPKAIQPSSPVVIGMKSGDKAVATVNGVPIPASRLKWAMKHANTGPNGLGKAAMLKLLILEEILFQQAVHEKFYNPSNPDLGDAYRKALATRFIQKHFEEDYPPSAISMKDLEPLYNLTFVRSKYDHKDIYRVYDMQWTCCHYAECGADQCFNDGKVLMHKVYEKIKDEKVSKEEIKDIVLSMRKIAPRLILQKYDFVYDWDKHYQKGRAVLDDNVVNAVIKLKVGSFSPPVRSGFGWHILFLWEHEPEQHLGLWAPAVQNDLRHFFYTKFQTNKFQQFLFHRLPWKQFGVLRRRIIPLIQQGQAVHQDPSQLYPIKIFQDAIDMAGANDSDMLKGM